MLYLWQCYFWQINFVTIAEMHIKAELIFIIKEENSLRISYSHREVMDFNKLTKLHGIMKDRPHSLLTSAKHFN